MSGDHNMYSSPVAMPDLGNRCKDVECEGEMTLDEYYKKLVDIARKYDAGQEDQGDIMSRQVGGNHYKRACQPWEIIEEWELNYWAGNIIKYVLRYPHKNGVEDLEKAKHYLEYLIKREKDALTTARD
jgi:hypothetical protein